MSAPTTSVYRQGGDNAPGQTEAALNRLLCDLPKYTNARLTREILVGRKVEVWRKPRARGSGTTRVVRIDGAHGSLVGGWMTMNDALHWAQQADLKLAKENSK